MTKFKYNLWYFCKCNVIKYIFFSDRKELPDNWESIFDSPDIQMWKVTDKKTGEVVYKGLSQLYHCILITHMFKKFRLFLFLKNQGLFNLVFAS